MEEVAEYLQPWLLYTSGHQPGPDVSYCTWDREQLLNFAFSYQNG
jgi:hypothetical protein